MNAIRSISTAALALLACQTGPARLNAPVPASAPAPVASRHQESVGKPQAPVVIEAELAPSSGRVLVRFDQEATNVTVRASGIDGLMLSGAPALAIGRSVAAGEVLTWDVPLQPGPGQSMLAVHVSGSFNGRERSAVRSFPIGLKAESQVQKAREGTTQIGGEGVKLVPAQETRK
jgi:hypothetical protein